jgi:hypothetical protein
VINTDADAAKANGTKVKAIYVTLKKMEAEGNILHGDTDREMLVALEGTALKGAIDGASLSVDADSKWMATASSKVTLVGNVEVAKIDAPAGITISAAAGKDCRLKGNYKLASGGALIVQANQ